MTCASQEGSRVLTDSVPNLAVHCQQRIDLYNLSIMISHACVWLVYFLRHGHEMHIEYA